MTSAQIPGFETPASEADWFTAILGGAILPGIVTVENLKVGIQCDTKKAKGSDQPTSQDMGLEPAKFDIRVWMNSAHYAEWQTVLPHFNPRRPGRERAPLEFLHPMTYEPGIRHVRVLSIESEQPTGVKGFVRVIKCEEWFDKPKPVKSGGKFEFKDTFDFELVKRNLKEGLVGEIARGIVATDGVWGKAAHTKRVKVLNHDPNTGKSVDPSSEESIAASMFGG